MPPSPFTKSHAVILFQHVTVSLLYIIASNQTDFMIYRGTGVRHFGMIWTGRALWNCSLNSLRLTGSTEMLFVNSLANRASLINLRSSALKTQLPLLFIYSTSISVLFRL